MLSEAVSKMLMVNNTLYTKHKTKISTIGKTKCVLYTFSDTVSILFIR